MTSLLDLHRTINGRLLPEEASRDTAEVSLGRVVADSRQVEQGDVFWALEGSRCHGSQFAADAFARGAGGAVVDAPVAVPEGRWAISVDDTYQALVQWAAFKRRRFTGTLLAVTGSVGKTTTRQMIHTVLQARLAGTASPRNYNNRLGLPLSMLSLEPCHDYAVLELGANCRGEIAELAGICAPKVGVITQIADAHLGGFGSRKAIAHSKAELLAALPPDGHAVLGDDPWLRRVADRCKCPITWVGLGPDCDVRAVDVKSEQGRLSFRVVSGSPLPPGEGCGEGEELGISSRTPEEPSPVPFTVPVWGRHHVTAALAAVAVGRMMGFDLPKIAAALEKYEAVPMRCEVIGIRGATIINDAYNSNPTAMRAALALLRDFDVSGRRIVVCGDMNELGPKSPKLHWQLGREIVDLGGAELLIACGRFARHVTAGARAAGLVRTRAIPCDTVEDALPYLGRAIVAGDVVLVKGSRMMGMERVVEALKQYPQRRTA